MRENFHPVVAGFAQGLVEGGVEGVVEEIVEENVRREELSAVPGQVECDAIAGHGVVALYALASSCPRCGAAV